MDIGTSPFMEPLMSSLTSEQLVAAQKSGVETSFAFLTKAFESIEKLAELNAKAVQSTLAENQEFAINALRSPTHSTSSSRAMRVLSSAGSRKIRRQEVKPQ